MTDVEVCRNTEVVCEGTMVLVEAVVIARVMTKPPLVTVALDFLYF